MCPRCQNRVCWQSSPNPKSLDLISTSISALWSFIPRHSCNTNIGCLSVGAAVEGAPYERDYLLPAPTNNFRGFQNKELKYPTAFAVQSQLVSLASYRGLKVFQSTNRHYYNRHSGRNFMPSATAVLGFSNRNHAVCGCGDFHES